MGNIVDTAFVADAVKRGAILRSVRAAADYRKGHMPGAINIPCGQNGTDNAGMSLKTEQELKQLHAARDPEKETIVYCRSGTRASETAVVLSKFGFTNVKVYEPS
jgi:thiosulfate/3-mercaptopyruvate sulfurtransferase